MDAVFFYKKYKPTLHSLSEYAHNAYLTCTIGQLSTAYECIRTVIRSLAADVAKVVNEDYTVIPDDKVKEFEKLMGEITQLIEKDMRTDVYAGVFEGWRLSNDWQSILREIPISSEEDS